MPYNYYANQYVPSGYNPYYQRQQEAMQQYNRPSMLLGKVVDNMEVVKGFDIPLDGSVSYFPLANGTAIVTKQLQQDGTSKMIIYKPVDEKADQPKFVTENDLSDIKKEIDALKQQLNSIEKRGD